MINHRWAERGPDCDADPEADRLPEISEGQTLKLLRAMRAIRVVRMLTLFADLWQAISVGSASPSGPRSAHR